MARELSSISPAQTASRPSHEEIAERAYEIFVKSGCPEGRDLDHWLEAEAQLIADRKQAQTPAGGKLQRGGSRSQTPPRR